ncbi:MAG: MFS transporter [Betaproteobacteria bacterium]|nr:MFS transporter [Betaproteobacteria bacterium]
MLSLARYTTILGRPELKGAIAASVLGRLPIGMAGLAIMLAVQESSGSFSRAGVITGFYIAGLAFLAPLLGRRIDRVGPRGVLAACGIAYPAMLCILVAAIRFDAPMPVALVIGFVAGACFPPITVCMRTFLKQRLADDALLSTAYSMESILIESIFIVGPMLVALFVAVLSAQAAVLFAAACAFAGTLMFLGSSALAHWRVEPRSPSSLFGPLAIEGFPVLLVTIVCYASAFGLVEIGVTGYAAEHARPALAGVLLALMSVGSAAGALAYGGRTWHAPLRRQFAAMLFLMGAGIAILAGITDAWLFALLSVFAGIVMAPALIIQSMLVAKIASARHATEAFTWSSTGLLAGVSAGIALGGLILESSPAAAVFVCAGVTAMAAAAIAVALLRER